jgi:glycosyltransferase involved in cell wall biosynthesis
MLTYNQEHFIAQAIESVLMQKTSFDYQLVLGEDCSTDSTRKICDKYGEQYPNRIKLLPALDKNIGLIFNYMRTIAACDGTYIAICDGDDYWIDELKLQKQVDFLESNADYAIVGSNLNKLYENGEIVPSKKNRVMSVYEFEDLIFGNLVPSVTALFRNIQLNDALPEWIVQFPYGDWPTYLWTIKHGGKIHFLEDVTAAYRMDIGVSAKIRKTNSTIAKLNLEILECILSETNFLHKSGIISRSIFNSKIKLMTNYNREKKYFNSLKLFVKIIVRNKKKYHTIKMYSYSFLKSKKIIYILIIFSLINSKL